jgi:clan AA aspartic protease (TIGR02281 family)
MQLIKWLSVLLSISLGANFWFIYNWATHKDALVTGINSLENSASDEPSHAWQQYSQDSIRSASQRNPKLTKSLATADERMRSQSTYLQWLKSMAEAQEFQQLEFEVSAYLRIYPQDTAAMLLEAQAYYHNKPLNVALVHYHALLTKPLTPKQHSDIEKLIAVNTTRVIQQISGDGAWNLLAQFLEPLVQVAPRNRQYLMALARAYGMQSQLTLMEDVLASFESTDIRAIRLRQNVNARLNQTSRTDEAVSLSDNIVDSALDNPRLADVLMQQERGQFVTRALIHNTPARLLVDTGASTTAISNETFNEIERRDVEFLGLFKVNTAGGLIEAPIYKVKQITIGHRIVTNTSVLILPSENLGQFDGLLGMNVLSQFDLSYDAASETMRMYKKR